MKIIYKRSLTFIGFLIAICGFIGIAYLFYDKVINSGTEVVVVDDLSINYIDSNTISHDGTYTFSVTNSGSKDIYYEITYDELKRFNHDIIYEITSKEKVYFAYNETEKENFIKEIGDKKFTVQRSKGLGENEPDMMSFTTMNPDTRRLIKVMPDNAAATSEMFDILLGDNLSVRRDYIIENGAKYIDDLDVS